MFFVTWNSNVVVREHRLLQSFGVIVKERTKIEIVVKKERRSRGEGAGSN